MRYVLSMLALLVIAIVPALFLVGPSTSLRGVGWLIVLAGALVVLVDLTDRLAEWVERRRWGRRR